MSKNSITRSTTILFVLLVSVALICADLVVLAQNENDTTRGGMMTSQNDNMTSGNTSTGNTPRRRRRNRRNASMSANVSGGVQDNGNMAAGAGVEANANMATSGTMGTTGRRRRGRRNRRMAATDVTTGTMTAGAGMQSSSGGEQTDLSGTYTGTVNYPEGGLNGPATLTITGTSFTLTPEGGGAAVNGRVTAVTTRGYTGVTMMFGDTTAPSPTQNPPPPPLPAVSLQARRSGGTVTLRSVPGERREFSFTSMAAAGTGRVRGRRRGRRGNRMRNINSNMGTMTNSNTTP